MIPNFGLLLHWHSNRLSYKSLHMKLFNLNIWSLHCLFLKVNLIIQVTLTITFSSSAAQLPLLLSCQIFHGLKLLHKWSTDDWEIPIFPSKAYKNTTHKITMCLFKTTFSKVIYKVIHLKYLYTLDICFGSLTSC